MSDFFAHLDDDLAAAPAPAIKHADRLSEANGGTRSFSEPCRKCGGTGRYGRLGACFACKGKGQLSFKTPAAERAKAREKAVERKADLIANSVAAFKAAHPDVMAWLVAETSKDQPFAFAVAMRNALGQYGELTERQLETCQRLVAQAAERKARWAAERAEREASAPRVNVDKLTMAFDRARESGLKWPKLRLGEIVVSPAGAASKNAGALYIKRGDDYLGKVSNGVFLATRACDEGNAAIVRKALADPAAEASMHGHLTGSCSCCGRELTDPESVKRGIGPICAERFGW